MKFNKYIFIIISIFVFTLPSYSVVTKFFSTKNTDFFANATHDGIMISENNTLKLAPATITIDGIVEPLVWKIYALNDDTIYVVTGGTKGKIYKFNAKEKTFSLFTEVEEENLTSIVVADDGTIFAASSPNSKLYVYDKNGDIKNRVQLDDIYVWDMEFDENGALYIAVGGKNARILVLEDISKLIDLSFDKNSNILNDKPSFKEIMLLNEMHAMDLSFDKNSNTMYVGTAGRGLLLSINDDYSYNVIYDTAEGEVHSVAMNSDGDVFFGTADREKNEILSKISGGDNNSQNGANKLFKNSLYKANGGNVVQKIFNLSQTLVFGLVNDNMDNIYFVTGDEGKLYQISSNGILNYVMSFDGQSITSISSTDDYIYLASKTGKVYKLTKEYAKTGTLISSPLDTGHLSRFGIADYYTTLPNGTGFEIQTRTGNTFTVDSTWSDFEVILSDGKIQSPKSRFLQYKVTLTTEDSTVTPVITSLSFSYLPENLRPDIYKPMLVTSYQQKNLEMELYKKPALKDGQAMIIWSGNDPNKDKLTYSLYYKLIGDTNYASLLKDTQTNYFIFDANRLPSGIYDFKVVASDYLNNGTAETKTNYIEVFNVKHDKDAPVISDVSFVVDAEKRMIIFTVTDEYSVLSSVRLASLNGRWRYLTPEDGLLDNKKENFSILIEDTKINSVTIEVVDVEGNVSYNSYVIK